LRRRFFASKLREFEGLDRSFSPRSAKMEPLESSAYILVCKGRVDLGFQFLSSRLFPFDFCAPLERVLDSSFGNGIAGLTDWSAGEGVKRVEGGKSLVNANEKLLPFKKEVEAISFTYPPSHKYEHAL